MSGKLDTRRLIPAVKHRQDTDQLKPDQWPLIFAMMHDLMMSVGAALKDTDPGYHPFISSSFSSFLGLLNKAEQVLRQFKPTGQLRFLDVGCGLGTLMYLARHRGWWADGVELSEQYAQISRLLNPDSETYNVNALDFDRYDKYDCIFFFTPIADRSKQAQLEDKIFDESKYPSVIITEFDTYLRVRREDIRQVEDRVYLKK